MREKDVPLFMNKLNNAESFLTLEKKFPFPSSQKKTYNPVKSL